MYSEGHRFYREYRGQGRREGWGMAGEREDEAS